MSTNVWNDIWPQIFRYLDPITVNRVRSVTKNFYKFSQREDIWEIIVTRLIGPGTRNYDSYMSLGLECARGKVIIIDRSNLPLRIYPQDSVPYLLEKLNINHKGRFITFCSGNRNGDSRIVSIFSVGYDSPVALF